jgi:Zn-dependent peptidase ImmA (M78 family)
LSNFNGSFEYKETILTPPPVSTKFVTLFDQQHTVEIRQLPLKAYHGAIWSQKDGWVIQVKDSDADPTMRFTIFHEAFHILAHSRTSPVFRKRGSVVGSFNELLADHFVGCILLPRGLVMETWAEVKDLNRMAEIFAVPKSAMCIKLRQLGLI